MTPRMSFLGMGNMGQAMSRNLATKAKLADPVIVWSRTTSNATTYAETEPHVKAVHTIAEAVQRSIFIWSCLSDDTAVVSTFDIILKTEDLKGKLFIECSTIHPDTTKAVAAKVLQRGAEFVAMPVFGEPSMAAESLLTLVPAGESKSVHKIRPYLSGVLGQTVLDYSGEPPEKALLLKLVGITFIINMIEALAEGHALAEKTGLGIDNLEHFIRAIFPAPYMLHSDHMTTGRYHRGTPIGNVAMVKHIAANIRELAESSGTKLPAFEVVRQNMDMIEDMVGPAGDIDGLYGVIRTLSGLPYKNN